MLLLPVPLLANDGGGCDIPYQPTNMLKVLFFYSDTMDYLANGPEQCRKDFAKEVRRVVTDTIIMTYGCIDATLLDIDKALAKKYGLPAPPKEIAK